MSDDDFYGIQALVAAQSHEHEAGLRTQQVDLMQAAIVEQQQFLAAQAEAVAALHASTAFDFTQFRRDLDSDSANYLIGQIYNTDSFVSPTPPDLSYDNGDPNLPYSVFVTRDEQTQHETDASIQAWSTQAQDAAHSDADGRLAVAEAAAMNALRDEAYRRAQDDADRFVIPQDAIVDNAVKGFVDDFVARRMEAADAQAEAARQDALAQAQREREEADRLYNEEIVRAQQAADEVFQRELSEEMRAVQQMIDAALYQFEADQLQRAEFEARAIGEQIFADVDRRADEAAVPLVDDLRHTVQAETDESIRMKLASWAEDDRRAGLDAVAAVGADAANGALEELRRLCFDDAYIEVFEPRRQELEREAQEELHRRLADFERAAADEARDMALAADERERAERLRLEDDARRAAEEHVRADLERDLVAAAAAATQHAEAIVHHQDADLRTSADEVRREAEAGAMVHWTDGHEERAAAFAAECEVHHQALAAARLEDDEARIREECVALTQRQAEAEAERRRDELVSDAHAAVAHRAEELQREAQAEASRRLEKALAPSHEAALEQAGEARDAAHNAIDRQCAAHIEAAAEDRDKHARVAAEVAAAEGERIRATGRRHAVALAEKIKEPQLDDVYTLLRAFLAKHKLAFVNDIETHIAHLAAQRESVLPGNVKQWLDTEFGVAVDGADRVRQIAARLEGQSTTLNLPAQGLKAANLLKETALATAAPGAQYRTSASTAPTAELIVAANAALARLAEAKVSPQGMVASDLNAVENGIRQLRFRQASAPDPAVQSALKAVTTRYSDMVHEAVSIQGSDASQVGGRRTSAAQTALDARTEGLVDLAAGRVGFGSHGTSALTRRILGNSGATHQSVHLMPQAVDRAIGASTGKALTVPNLPTATHRQIDGHWVPLWNSAVARGRRITGAHVLAWVGEGIQNTPDSMLPQLARNTIEWRLSLELKELGIEPDTIVVPGS
jgi:hypothetical protein